MGECVILLAIDKNKKNLYKFEDELKKKAAI
jgi:hypothetical protein